MIIFKSLKTNNTERYISFLPKGFTCSKNVGIKDDTLDCFVILSTVPVQRDSCLLKIISVGHAFQLEKKIPQLDN